MVCAVSQSLEDSSRPGRLLAVELLSSEPAKSDPSKRAYSVATLSAPVGACLHFAGL